MKRLLDESVCEGHKNQNIMTLLLSDKYFYVKDVDSTSPQNQTFISTSADKSNVLRLISFNAASFFTARTFCYYDLSPAID